MEFRFNLNEVFKKPIVEVGQSLIPSDFKGDRRTLWDALSKVTDVINAMGTASAAAQNLTRPITSADRLRNSEQQQVYLLIDHDANEGKGAVTGMLKTGKKGLYVFDRDGHHYHVQAPCVLDFYVHESRQRSGFGKKIFEHMLQREDVQPGKLAIDRPSEKFLGFLNKHYNLNNPIRQMNNYVVYDGFFPQVGNNSEKTPMNNNGDTVSKRGSNGLQAQTVTSPYGRYGAPRPPCSMGQIIHNQSSTMPVQEPTGTEEGVLNAQNEYHWPFVIPSEDYPNQIRCVNLVNPPQGNMYELLQPDSIKTQTTRPVKIPLDERGRPQSSVKNRTLEQHQHQPHHQPHHQHQNVVHRQDSKNQNSNVVVLAKAHHHNKLVDLSSRRDDCFNHFSQPCFTYDDGSTVILPQDGNFENLIPYNACMPAENEHCLNEHTQNYYAGHNQHYYNQNQEPLPDSYPNANNNQQQLLNSLPNTNNQQHLPNSLSSTNNHQQLINSLPNTNQQHLANALPNANNQQHLPHSLPSTNSQPQLINPLPNTNQQVLANALPNANNQQHLSNSLPIANNQPHVINSLPNADNQQYLHHSLPNAQNESQQFANNEMGDGFYNQELLQNAQQQASNRKEAQIGQQNRIMPATIGQPHKVISKHGGLPRIDEELIQKVPPQNYQINYQHQNNIEGVHQNLNQQAACPQHAQMADQYVLNKHQQFQQHGDSQAVNQQHLGLNQNQIQLQQHPANYQKGQYLEQQNYANRQEAQNYQTNVPQEIPAHQQQQNYYSPETQHGLNYVNAQRLQKLNLNRQQELSNVQTQPQVVHQSHVNYQQDPNNIPAQEEIVLNNIPSQQQMLHQNHINYQQEPNNISAQQQIVYPNHVSYKQESNNIPTQQKIVPNNIPAQQQIVHQNYIHYQQEPNNIPAQQKIVSNNIPAQQFVSNNIPAQQQIVHPNHVNYHQDPNNIPAQQQIIQQNHPQDIQSNQHQMSNILNQNYKLDGQNINVGQNQYPQQGNINYEQKQPTMYHQGNSQQPIQNQQKQVYPQVTEDLNNNTVNENGHKTPNWLNPAHYQNVFENNYPITDVIEQPCVNKSSDQYIETQNNSSSGDANIQQQNLINQGVAIQNTGINRNAYIEQQKPTNWPTQHQSPEIQNIEGQKASTDQSVEMQNKGFNIDGQQLVNDQRVEVQNTGFIGNTNIDAQSNLEPLMPACRDQQGAEIKQQRQSYQSNLNNPEIAGVHQQAENFYRNVQKINAHQQGKMQPMQNQLIPNQYNGYNQKQQQRINQPQMVEMNQNLQGLVIQGSNQPQMVRVINQNQQELTPQGQLKMDGLMDHSRQELTTVENPERNQQRGFDNQGANRDVAKNELRQQENIIRGNSYNTQQTRIDQSFDNQTDQSKAELSQNMESPHVHSYGDFARDGYHHKLGEKVSTNGLQVQMMTQNESFIKLPGHEERLQPVDPLQRHSANYRRKLLVQSDVLNQQERRRPTPVSPLSRNMMRAREAAQSPKVFERQSQIYCGEQAKKPSCVSVTRQQAGSKIISHGGAQTPVRASEESTPQPKLDRPQTLSLHTSSNDQNNPLPQIIDDDDEIEIDNHSELDNVENDFMRVEVSPGNNKPPPHGDVDDEHAARKTPSHLTEQGYFDLKFYHNKLW